MLTLASAADGRIIRKLPRERVRAGEGVAFTPDGRHLVVAFNDAQGGQLVRVPLDGGIEEPIVLKSSVRLSGGVNLAPNAVAPDGRIIHRIVPPIHGSGLRP